MVDGLVDFESLVGARSSINDIPEQVANHHLYSGGPIEGEHL